MFRWKKIWVAVQCVETDERGKTWRHSFVDELGGSNNLLYEVEQLKLRSGAEFILVCNTKKEAQEVVSDWNSTAQNAGRYVLAEAANRTYHAEERQTA